jgi:hypothetical protein
MRLLLHLITTALLIVATSFAFAQDASIQIEQPLVPGNAGGCQHWSSLSDDYQQIA